MSWRTFRNGLQQVHLWVGLTLSIPFILIGLSGSAIVADAEPSRFQRAVRDVERRPSSADTDHRDREQVGAERRSARLLIRMPQGIWQPAHVQMAPPPGVVVPGGAKQSDHRHDLCRSCLARSPRQRGAAPQRPVHALSDVDASGADVPVLLRRTDRRLDGRRDVPVRYVRSHPVVAKARAVALGPV